LLSFGIFFDGGFGAKEVVMDSKPEKIALFRYGLIATLVLERLTRGELSRRARQLAGHDYDIPFFRSAADTCGHAVALGAVRYRTGGLEAVAPQRRSDRGRLGLMSQQPGSPVYATDFDVAGVKGALSEATKERKPEWRATANSPGSFAQPA
jgi:hypothetical protein